MPLALTVDAVYDGLGLQDVYGTITASGNYPTHGDALDFSGFDLIKSQSVPVQVEVYEAPAAGTSPSGYVYGPFCPGTDNTNGQLPIFESGGSAAPLSELAAGAYPAGITGAVIKYHARFVRG